MMFRDSEIRRFGWLGKVNPEGLHLPFDMREDMFGIRQFLDAQGRQAMRFEFFCDFVGGQMAADIRKFPETCEQALGRAFVQGNIFPLTQHEDGEFFHAPFFLDDFDGKFLRAARVMGEAEAGERAALAVRRAVRQADGCAEVHEGLIERAGFAAFRIMRGKGSFYGALRRVFGDILAAGEHAHHDAQDVAVDGRQRQTEGDGANGTGRITADARQGEELCKICGHLPVILRRDFGGCFFEIARAAVVAEPLPELHEKFIIAGSKGGNVGQSRKEAVIIGDDRRSPCLL